jgi:hypothetical protein
MADRFNITGFFISCLTGILTAIFVAMPSYAQMMDSPGGGIARPKGEPRSGGMGTGGAAGIGAGIIIDAIGNSARGSKEDIAAEPRNAKGGKKFTRETAPRKKRGKRGDDDTPANAKAPNPPPATTDKPSQTVDTPKQPGPPPTNPGPPTSTTTTTTTDQPPGSDIPKTTERKTDEPKPGGGPHAPPPNVVVLDELKICGPDVTELVLAALRNIKSDFDNADPVARGDMCEKMHSFPAGISAWDIKGLGPESSPSTDSKGRPDAYDPVSNKWKRPNGTLFSPWLTGVSDRCAVPRPECAHTVELFGTCQHAQVVNYTMWGVMTRLCPNIDNNIVRAGYAKAKALSHGKWTGDYEPQEDLMIEVGNAYYDEMLKNPQKPDTKDIGDSLRLRYKTMFGFNPPPETQCTPACKLTDTEKKKLQDLFSGYRWNGMPGHRF